MDVERTVDVLSAITAGLMRVLELLIPFMIVAIMGITKGLLVAFGSVNAYRKSGKRESLLTDLDEI